MPEILSREEKARAQLLSLREKKKLASSGGSGGGGGGGGGGSGGVSVPSHLPTHTQPPSGSWSRFINRDGTGQETDIEALLGWRPAQTGGPAEFDSDDDEDSEDDFNETSPAKWHAW